jgi:hypothetical protein
MLCAIKGQNQYSILLKFSKEISLLKLLLIRTCFTFNYLTGDYLIKKLFNIRRNILYSNIRQKFSGEYYFHFHIKYN